MRVFQAVVATSIAVGRVAANCECGYSASVYRQDSPFLFTDLIETDFTANGLTLFDDTDWAAEQYSQPAAVARGTYGEDFLNHGAQLQAGSGISLLVGHQPENGMIPCAELTSTRQDLFYGSFRVGMTVTDQPGTCSAFFWYFNDTQEIDMEFLSREFNFENSTFPVNLVLQSRQSLRAGYDASKTPYFKTVNLPFNPTVGMHEYRIDYTAKSVVFYADGLVLAEMSGPGVPSSAGELLISHWSNGNDEWSGGPPPKNAIMTIAYIKAYFNSSSPIRVGDWEERCLDRLEPGAVCDIPGTYSTTAPTESSLISSSPSAATTSPAGFFFYTHHNMTANQSVYQQLSNFNSASAASFEWGTLPSRWALTAATLLVGALVLV